jgi:hypothetical protein
MLTATVSVFSYIWLLIIVVWSTPGVITLAEALLTFVFFWILLAAAYLCDRKCFMDRKQVAPMSKTVADLSNDLPSSSKGGEGPLGEGQVKALTHKPRPHPLNLTPKTSPPPHRLAR